MKKNIIVFSFLIFFSNTLSAQKEKPAWIYNKHSLFPQEKYFVGMASAKTKNISNEPELLEQLKENAKIDLLNSIYITIESQTKLIIKNANNESDESVEQTSSSQAKIEIKNIQFDTYFDTKNQEGYAIAYAEKNEQKENYKKEVIEYQKKLEHLANEEYKGTDSSIKNYFDALEACQQYAHSKKILLFIDPNIEKKDDEIKDVFSRFQTLDKKIKLAIKKIYQEDTFDIELATTVIARLFKAQIKKTITDPIILKNIVSEQDGKTHILSQKLIQQLETKLISISSLPIAIKKNNTQLTLSGKYREEKDRIQVILILYQNNKAIMEASTRISKKYLIRNNIEY